MLRVRGSCYVEGLCTFASSAIRHFADLMLAGGALLRRHVREGRGKGNAWLPVRLLVVAALGNLGNRMLHLLLPSQPQARGMERNLALTMAKRGDPAARGACSLRVAPRVPPTYLSVHQVSMAGEAPLPAQAQRGITLRHAARRFAACAKGDDVHVEDFAEATEQMMTIVERFGSFTKRGVADVRQNLRRVREKG